MKPITFPRRLLAALILVPAVLLGACGGPATAPPPPVIAPPDTHELTKADLDAWLDGKLPDVLTHGKASGAVVTVVKDGEILTNRGYGYATRAENGRPATPVDPEATLFRWGSISKVPTSIAVLQLVEQGKLDLDADIATYLDFPLKKQHDEPITLRHLLTHTAGFEETSTMFVPALQKTALADYVRHNPPVSVYRPGTTPAYSNYGMTLAGYLVEQASGQPFPAYLQEHVLSPAGMTTASYDQPLSTQTLAVAYDPDGQSAPFEFIPDTPAGSLAGSGADAAAFLLAQLDRSPAILSAERWEEMWTPALGADTLGNLANSPRMGLGYFTGTRNGHRIVEHGGDLRYHHSQFELYPDDQVGIFISYVDDGGGSDAAATLRADLMAGFADRYFPTAAADTPPLEGSGARANQVAGTYFLSRSVITTWQSAWSGVTSVTIQALPNGNLLAQNREYVEIAPWTWQDPHADGFGSTLTARVVNGQVEAVSVGPAFTLLPLTSTQQALIPVFLVSLATFTLVLLAWAVGALRRWRRGQRTAGLPWTARLARLGALSATAALLGWIGVGASALLGGNLELLGNIPLLRTIQVLQWAGVAAIIPAVFDIITVVKTRSAWRRPTMAALLLLALLATAWWAWAGHSLNPNLGV
ncbi:serine hydrolase domain-containing protein [Buchananella hordeovulneris]|uniref:serine hydrolase domain-containing protein n=1 Tax=Buchananella hordeovulneris TaxID=52770 RepID=UPI000F5D6C3A|nr:serine hydrolase domain-containing protein [Buchananella hordeovulneris]RRD44101.1 class A beta-lactamase-related serine hydrolase [Buchananella hordeovulneris]